jgi:hypothetical protein
MRVKYFVLYSVLLFVDVSVSFAVLRQPIVLLPLLVYGVSIHAMLSIGKINKEHGVQIQQTPRFAFFKREPRLLLTILFVEFVAVTLKMGGHSPVVDFFSSAALLIVGLIAAFLAPIYL